MKVWIALLVASAITLTPTLVLAEDPRAEALLERGASLRERGRYEAALREFVHANSIESTPRSLAQLGLTHGTLEHWVDAFEFLRAAMQSESDPWIRSRWRNLESGMREVRRHVGFLHITGSAEGVRVIVGERDVGALPIEQSVPVLPGAVVVQFRRGTAILFSREATVEVAATVEIDVSTEWALQPPAPAPTPVPAPVAVPLPEAAVHVSGTATPPSDRGVLPTVGFILVGTGAVALATGVVFHVMRESAAGAANDCRLGLPSCVGTAEDHVSAADRDEVLAITGYVAGGLLVGAGVALLILAPGRDRSDTQASAWSCAPSFGSVLGAGCAGQF